MSEKMNSFECDGCRKIVSKSSLQTALDWVSITTIDLERRHFCSKECAKSAGYEINEPDKK